MSQPTARVLVVALVGFIALLVAVAPLPAVAACASPALRTFTPEQRQQLETQYGVNWWKAMGLIPGPETAADYVERPFGDSRVTVYMPQRFWDPRACVPGPDRSARPRRAD